MATSKHVRKTGATTVKRDGKIVANIGRGKTKIPTIAKETIVEDMCNTPVTKENDNLSPVMKSLQKIKDISADSDNYDTAIMLWNLMDNHDDRINLLPNLFANLTKEERRRCLHQILDKSGEKFYIVKMVDYGKADDETKILLMKYCPESLIRGRVIISDHNDTLPLLELGTQDSDEFIRYLTAQRIPSQYENLSEILVKDDKTQVRMGCAMNPDASEETLSKLAYDESEDVLCRVVRNLNAPADTLARLSTHESLPVLVGVAQHNNTPKKILAKLMTHPEEFVSTSAMATYYIEEACEQNE